MSIEILTPQAGAAIPALWPSVAERAGNTSAQAEIESTARLEQARRDGFANGVASAHQEAEQILFPAIQKLADSVAQAARMRDAIRAQATDDLVQLALQIAERVMHRDVALDSTVLAGLLRAAFSKLQSQEICVAHVHPAVLPILRGCLERNGAPANLRVLTDPKLRPGELAFETGVSGASPAGVDLSEIERGLSDRLIK
jgi:flagellar assembly protein FliH